MSRALVFSTDLHGRTSGFKAVMAYAAKNGIDSVVFGGDINPTRYFLKFKDGIIIPERYAAKEDAGYGTEGRAQSRSIQPLDSLSSRKDTRWNIQDAARLWLNGAIELNEKAAQSDDAEKALGVSEMHYAINIGRRFRDAAARFELLYQRLGEHISGNKTYEGSLSKEAVKRLRSETGPLHDSIVWCPDEKERQLLIKEIIPLIRKKLALSLKRGRAAEELLEVYLDCAGSIPKIPPGTRFMKEILYLWMHDAIGRAFLSETAKLMKLVTGWRNIDAFKPDAERGQIRWLKGSLLPEIRAFARTNPGRRVFIMPGNDDVGETIEVLQEAETQGILTQLHGRVVPLDRQFDIGGYSFVSKLPHDVRADWLKDEEEIRADLEGIFRPSAQERTILSIHVPPENGLLDITLRGEHIGSSAVRNYLSTARHPLVLTGHVHETVARTGNWKESIGATLVMSPGASHQNGIDALIVNLDDVGKTARVEIS